MGGKERTGRISGGAARDRPAPPDDLGSGVALREPRWQLSAKALNTRELILKEARALFLARGYGGTSIDHIARECRLSRGALYTYFGSKFEVFLALGTSTYKRQVAVIMRFYDLPTPCDRADIEGWVRGYFDFMSDEGALMLSAGPDVPPEPWFRQQIVALTTRSAARLGHAIQQHNGRTDVSPEALGLVALSVLERSWFFIYGMEMPVDEDQVISEVSTTLLGFMQPEPR